MPNKILMKDLMKERHLISLAILKLYLEYLNEKLKIKIRRRMSTLETKSIAASL